MLPFGCQALGSHPCVALSSWRWRLYQLSWGVDNSFFWMSRKIRETSYRRIGVPPDGVFYPLSETMGEVRAKTRAKIRASKGLPRRGVMEDYWRCRHLRCRALFPPQAPPLAAAHLGGFGGGKPDGGLAPHFKQSPSMKAFGAMSIARRKGGTGSPPLSKSVGPKIHRFDSTSDVFF